MKQPKATTDPLLAALIAKLPASDTEWPVDRQLAWLKMMAMAFATVYGGDVLSQMGNVQAAAPAAPEPPKAQQQASPPPAKPKITYPFMIDKHGYARKGNTGQRVMPHEVTDMIGDERGMEGDMGTIIWADDSMGVNGLDLTIVWMQ